MQQEGEGAHNLPLHAPPLYLPCLHAALHAKGGGWAQGGEVGGARRGHHVGDMAAHPCTLFTNGGGGGVPRVNPLLCPVGGQMRGPRLYMSGGEPKGWWGVLCSLSCANHRGLRLRPNGGAYLLCATLCPHSCVPCLCTEVRWCNPCAWRVGGTSRGRAEAGAMRHWGGGVYACTPTPFAHPLRVCFPAKGGGRCQWEEARGGGVVFDHSSHVSCEYTETHCCLHIVLLCFYLFLNFYICFSSQKYKEIKLLKSGVLN
jgi:hypothetical protein